MSIGSALSSAGRGVQRGYQAWLSDADRTGPAYQVTPFEPGTVTTGAGLLKLGATIAAARRQRANFDYAQQSREATLASDHAKTMAEIEHLGAETQQAKANAEYLGRRQPEQELYDVPVDLGDGRKVTVRLTGDQVAKRGIALAGLKSITNYRQTIANRPPAGAHAGDNAALQGARTVFADTDNQVKHEAERRADAQLAQEIGVMSGTGSDMNDDQRAHNLGMTTKEYRKRRGDPKLRVDWQAKRRASLVQQFAAKLYQDPRIVKARSGAARTIQNIARMDTTGTYDVFGAGAQQQNDTGALSDAIKRLTDYTQSP